MSYVVAKSKQLKPKKRQTEDGIKRATKNQLYSNIEEDYSDP